MPNILPNITSPPVSPSPTDGAAFGSRAFAFLKWMYTAFGTEIPALIAAINQLGPDAALATTKAAEAAASAASALESALQAAALAGVDLSGFLSSALGDIKGDQIVFTGPDTPARLPAPSNGWVYVGDSSQANGLRAMNRLSVKSFGFTHDLSLTGAQDISLGFDPKAVWITGGIHTGRAAVLLSMMSDNGAQGTLSDYTSGNYTSVYGAPFYLWTTTAAYAAGAMTFGTGKVTFNWSTVGGPTGTAQMSGIAIG